MSGAISAAGGPGVASSYAGTGATYLVNEICSYIPGVAEFNGNETHKEITEDNIRQSFKTYSKYGIKTTMEAGMESSHCIINEYIQDRIIPFGKDKLQLPFVEVFPTL